jgi:hypothetical protein
VVSTRLSPYLVEQIVSTLTLNPDRCVVMALGMNPSPRITRDGKRWSLHRYLYWRATGVELPRTLALLEGGCLTRGCINPHHRKVSSVRGTGPRTACPNGHEYTPSNIMHGHGRYKCLTCHEARLARRRTTEFRRGWCRQGHRLSRDNVYLWTDASGKTHRRCRRCQLDRQHAYRNRSKENR